MHAVHLLPLLAAGLAACATATATTDLRSDEGPVVLELFTSQGCSSCPPADELLGRLAHAGSLAGRPIVPLAFHVDYWNELGWADTFSQPAWTERQQAYAQALGDRSIYTPELVVAGGVGMNGAHVAGVEAAVAAAPHQAALDASARWEPERVTVQATAPADADVWVAIWQPPSRTKIERGENRGETLVGEHVVRRLERVARAGHAGHVTIELDSHAEGAVAFAQRRDLHIVGARLLPR